MTNKSRISGRHSRGSSQEKAEGELPMADQVQIAEEQPNVEQQAEELQGHEETG